MRAIERVYIDVPENYVGAVIEKLGARKGELVNLTALSESMRRLEILIPSRGLFGYRGSFLTDTRGEGVMNTILDGYQPFKGEIPSRQLGSLIAFETAKPSPTAFLTLRSGELCSSAGNAGI